ncbi:hypothetical protein OAR81_00820 [Candidatus Pelagibacter sp.]|nr:hypothetical protein [Candidatus Pelagibacter sp.]
MKKKPFDSNNEIDLIELIEIFWNEKIKIVLITIILVVITYGYNQLPPKSKPQEQLYKNLLTINPANTSEFIKFAPLYHQLNFSSVQQTDNLKIINQQILQEFLIELLDFEELVYVLGNNKSVLEEVSNLTDEEKTIKLFNYAKLLTVATPDEQLSGNPKKYLISFVWKDPNETKEILDQTIKLVIINLKKNIFNGLEDMLEIKEANMKNEDLIRIQFLREQSLIAKELGLEDNQVDNFSSSSSQYNLSLNINNNNIAYYLRGYKAIDKEINIIKDRNYTGLLSLKNKLKDLKKSDVEWIKYNVNLLDSKLLPKNISKNLETIPLYLSILFGLIIGLFYAYIYKVIQSRKITKK